MYNIAWEIRETCEQKDVDETYIIEYNFTQQLITIVSSVLQDSASDVRRL